MKRLLVCFFLLFALSANAHVINSPRVLDGDTIDSGIKPFENISAIKIRILGVDTPELRGKCEKEKQLAKNAKAYLVSLVKDKSVSFDVVSWDKYGGRVNAVAYVNNENVADLLVSNGYAVKYFGSGPRKDWCK